MKYTVIFALLLSTSLVQANYEETDCDEINTQETSLASSFTHFMNSFIALLSEKTAQAKILLHKLIHSVIEICQQLGHGKKSPISFDSIDQQALDELSDIAIIHARTIALLRNKPTSKAIEAKQKKDVQKILNFFAGVVQNFFAIVQAPENKQNVAQGIIGMLGNIAAAGNTIIDNTNEAADATPEQIVDAMDEETKLQILKIIQSQRKSIRIQTDIATE